MISQGSKLESYGFTGFQVRVPQRSESMINRVQSRSSGFIVRDSQGSRFCLCVVRR